ncbi:MAG TPA: helix-turn-helix transcriptional regulator [Firmicutes bacterium]|nr:helix-turn-helix transcriptional regulator [Candidatus Fermentithermobacillaceae bacterium]
MLRMKLERLRRGWSLTQLCVRTGIEPASLSKIERGIWPCGPGWRKRIAQALEVPEEALFEEVPDHEAPIGYRPSSSPR